MYNNKSSVTYRPQLITETQIGHFVTCLIIIAFFIVAVMES
jgi:hypothetical protein